MKIITNYNTLNVCTGEQLEGYYFLDKGKKI